MSIFEGGRAGFMGVDGQCATVSNMHFNYNVLHHDFRA